jgi:hypothetical protein
LAAEERGQQRYIVILKKRTGPTPDVARLGGTIESRQDDQVVVTIPSGALAALKGDPAVYYLERVGGTAADDESLLIGVPSDPQPGPSVQAARFTPHPLGTLSWDSGTYKYDGAGNIVSIGTDNYLYDGVQRLKQSSTQGSGETYTYDGFGPYWGQAFDPTSCRATASDSCLLFLSELLSNHRTGGRPRPGGPESMEFRGK